MDTSQSASETPSQFSNQVLGACKNCGNPIGAFRNAWYTMTDLVNPTLPGYCLPENRELSVYTKATRDSNWTLLPGQPAKQCHVLHLCCEKCGHGLGLRIIDSVQKTELPPNMELLNLNLINLRKFVDRVAKEEVRPNILGTYWSSPMLLMARNQQQQHNFLEHDQPQLAAVDNGKSSHPPQQQEGKPEDTWRCVSTISFCIEASDL